MDPLCVVGGRVPLAVFHDAPWVVVEIGQLTRSMNATMPSTDTKARRGHWRRLKCFLWVPLFVTAISDRALCRSFSKPLRTSPLCLLLSRLTQVRGFRHRHFGFPPCLSVGIPTPEDGVDIASRKRLYVRHEQAQEMRVLRDDASWVAWRYEVPLLSGLGEALFSEVLEGAVAEG